jgi:hypothetical protein
VGRNAVEIGERERFRKNFLPPYSGSKSNPSKNLKEAGLPSAFVVFFIDLLFENEDRGDMFFRSDGIFPNCTALQARRPDLIIMGGR